MILIAVALASARAYCTLMPGYFFSNAAAIGRASWSTIRVVYQTTVPSFFAASTSCRLAAVAGPTAANADKNAATSAVKNGNRLIVVRSRTLDRSAEQLIDDLGPLRHVLLDLGRREDRRLEVAAL